MFLKNQKAHCFKDSPVVENLLTLTLETPFINSESTLPNQFITIVFFILYFFLNQGMCLLKDLKFGAMQALNVIILIVLFLHVH